MKPIHSTHRLALSLCLLSTALAAPAAMAQNGNASAQAFGESRPIPGHYIVVFKNSVADPRATAISLAQALGGQVQHVYSHSLKGFSASIPDTALQGLHNNPNVAYVEPDQTVSLNQSVQNGATWGLDRIDQTALPLNAQYQYTGTGAGIKAFIIDTGIRPDHSEFTGRLQAGYTAVADGNGTTDCNGHGTHVAGTVGGTTWGVAKSVALIPVRVLDCAGSGSYSGVIAGVDWVAASALRPAVANMSLGGGASSAVNAAVAGAVSKGVVMVVAAGNNNRNACQFSPASEPSAITVGATTSSDSRASYSNYGSCVDIFAPGSSITSAWNTASNAINTISGTSMASPHVAGVAALALQANPGVTPQVVASILSANATPNVISSVGSGSPNLLVYSLATAAPAQPAVQTVAVGALSGTAQVQRKGWKAYATVNVFFTGTGGPVKAATVSASFNPGGSASCVTDDAGTCTMSSSSLNSRYSSTQVTVSDITGSNMAYDAGLNAATQIVISKP